MKQMSAQNVIQALKLEPLNQEGGYFRRTYESKAQAASRALASAIYYLITKDDYSALHRVGVDEIFHFYCGDAVQLFQIDPAGKPQTTILGNKLEAGQLPQLLVPAGCWQGLRLVEGGDWALLGTTCHPGFVYSDFEIGERSKVLAQHPHLASNEQLELLLKG